MAFKTAFIGKSKHFVIEDVYKRQASSMFVEQVLRTYITGPVVMLDLCAAPGGKSTH